MRCLKCFEEEDTIRTVVAKAYSVAMSYRDDPEAILVHPTCKCGFTYTASVYRGPASNAQSEDFKFCQKWILQKKIDGGRLDRTRESTAA